FRLSSRVRDKRTRTVEVCHKLTTFIVLCSPKSNSSQNLKDLATRKPGTTESFPSPDSLVLRMLVLRTSDCPSPTLIAQPERDRLMCTNF
ncbi:hypothetical protein ES332_A11G265700v1, partial [Gossypium tomentosum]